MSEFDQNQLLESCRQLENELTNIRALKLSTQIEIYEKQCENDYEIELQKRNNLIELEYSKKKLQLRKQYEESLNKCVKNKQQMGKQLTAFETILQELSNRKNNLEEEYNQNVGKLMAFKEKCIVQWKKNSNQNIKKTNYFSLMGKGLDKHKIRHTSLMGLQSKQKLATQPTHYDTVREDIVRK